MNSPISITAIASISPLGISQKEVWEQYLNDDTALIKLNFDGTDTWVGALGDEAKEQILALKESDSKYKNLDDSVLFALFASREAMKTAGWSKEANFGVNIGSSRGATALFEKYFEEYLKNKTSSTLASPTTTLGNISSWIAHDLQTQGPEISHSITCSTALHALLNGYAWIKSGMVNKFMVGGSEAPLTPFTIAQIRALKIYARDATSPPQNEDNLISASPGYPCQAFNLEKTQNTMVLGEGASVVCLEQGVPENALAIIEGIGYATEVLEHNISISTDAVCFQRSMKMALGGLNPDEVDVIVLHAPGTIKGDSSEIKAIEKIFCNKVPFLTTNKWKIGHTFGASGMLSLELALLMMQHQKAIKVPYVTYDSVPEKISRVLVNAVGFGGNAVSILLKRVE
ncbi:Beta-ketoacyl-acyl-carrier-protein synthase I [Cellulophaga algicola DSM 14237]|uniref:Beta-ketoacyl-acyl-carrier-protein synthase I n=1 Tax=Cellulophaga algicola (strain DSM 14237 / IC166 / ACAM 630) TaxID=688270 RepID=E6X5R0_CELAD|nr:beta-ketoacyl synthase N-terminal-like domain-containing protein [Cellulophaga algicola]ADV48426.1 Beta-ketoacyl-acyl-carrier-protein synthase I [Cellulophaga algicola DSM 14237]